MWKVVDVVHLNVLLGICWDTSSEMKSITAFMLTDILRNFDVFVPFLSVIIHSEVVGA